MTTHMKNLSKWLGNRLGSPVGAFDTDKLAQKPAATTTSTSSIPVAPPLNSAAVPSNVSVSTPTAKSHARTHVKQPPHEKTFEEERDAAIAKRHKRRAVGDGALFDQIIEACRSTGNEGVNLEEEYYGILKEMRFFDTAVHNAAPVTAFPAAPKSVQKSPRPVVSSNVEQSQASVRPSQVRSAVQRRREKLQNQEHAVHEEQESVESESPDMFAMKELDCGIDALDLLSTHTSTHLKSASKDIDVADLAALPRVERSRSDSMNSEEALNHSLDQIMDSLGHAESHIQRAIAGSQGDHRRTVSMGSVGGALEVAREDSKEFSRGLVLKRTPNSSHSRKRHNTVSSDSEGPSTPTRKVQAQEQDPEQQEEFRPMEEQVSKHMRSHSRTLRHGHVSKTSSGSQELQPSPGSHLRTDSTNDVMEKMVSPNCRRLSSLNDVSFILKMHLDKQSKKKAASSQLGAIIEDSSSTPSHETATATPSLCMRQTDRVSRLADERRQAKEERRRVKRDRMNRELLETETIYVRHLTNFIQVFVTPLQSASVRERAGISETQCRALFGNIEMIAYLHSQFLKRLTMGFSRGDLFRVFNRNADFLKIYNQYVSEYDVATQTLAQLMNQKKSKRWLEEQARSHSKQLKHLQIASFLVMPIQRIPRYRMLLDGIRELTEETRADQAEDPDSSDDSQADSHYAALCAASDKVRTIASHINEHKRKVESMQMVLQVHTDFNLEKRPEALGGQPLMQPHRRFVRREMVQFLLPKNKKYDLVLFNDLLLWGLNAKLKGLVWLQNTTVSAGTDSCTVKLSNSVGASTGQDFVIILSFPTDEEKQGWLDDIERSIGEDRATKENINRRTPSFIRAKSVSNATVAAKRENSEDEDSLSFFEDGNRTVPRTFGSVLAQIAGTDSPKMRLSRTLKETKSGRFSRPSLPTFE